MAIQGMSNAEHFNNPSLRRPTNVREGILRLHQTGGRLSQAPLTALTAAMRNATTNDPKFSWFEKAAAPRRFVLSSLLVGAGTFTLAADANAIPIGAVCMIEHTGELVRVTAVNSDTSIDVTRGFGGGPAAAALTPSTTVSPYMTIVGTAFEENSVAPAPTGFDPTEEYNYCQIFRETYGLSNTAGATHLRTGDATLEAKKDCLENFAIDMERAFLFGARSIGTLSGKPIRTTAGLKNIIPAGNKLSGVGAVDYDWWEQTSEKIFRLGSEEKLAFIGLRTLTAINAMIRKNTSNDFALTATTKEYGMNVRRLTTPHGTLVLKPHPLFSMMMGASALGISGSSYVGMDNAMVVLDMNDIRYRALTGRDMKYEKDLQVPGQDGLLAGYIAEAGLEVNHKTKHWWIEGITSGAKDA